MLRQTERFLKWIELKARTYPRSILLFSLAIVLLLPLLLTRFGWIGFSSGSGNIGDTIGGITGPFIAIISALLVFYSFKEQIAANKQLAQMREEDIKAQLAEKLFGRIEQAIAEFKYRDHVKGQASIEEYLFDLASRVDSAARSAKHDDKITSLSDWVRFNYKPELMALLVMVDYLVYFLNRSKLQKELDTYYRYMLREKYRFSFNELSGLKHHLDKLRDKGYSFVELDNIADYAEEHQETIMAWATHKPRGSISKFD